MAARIKSRFVDLVAQNFKLPQSGFVGWITCKYFERRNGFLETKAVQLCNIKPDHNVLEIGFGPGLGLEAAYNIVKNGKGRVYGIDTSFYMVQRAQDRLKKGVRDKKVMLFHGSATEIPLNTDSVNRVFHCNCYYFWPSMRSVMREIYRVMQPGAVMVTTLSLDNIKKSYNRGFLKCGHPDPVKYMQCLENYGFDNVRLDYHTDPQTGKQFQAILCEVSEKPAHDKAIDSDADKDDIEQELQEMFESRLAERRQSLDKHISEVNMSPLHAHLNIGPGTDSKS